MSRKPSGGAHANERRDAEHETLAHEVTWLRGQADAVAATRPMLRAAVAAGTKASGAAAASELRDLGSRAEDQVAAAREGIERLASELELAVKHRAHGEGDGSALLPEESDRGALTSSADPSADEIKRLIADVSEDLPGDEGERCRRRLSRASPSELSLLSDVAAAGLTHDQLLRLLEGGHLLLPGHHLLARWRRLPGVTPRTSSHYHPDDRRIGRGPEWLEKARARVDDAHAHPIYGQQYGLRGAFVHEALFGPGPHRTTFLQLERAAPSKLHLPQHIADWIRYRLSRRNQGPYGATGDTDARPMRAVVWWKPSKRSSDALRLQETGTETEQIVSTLLGVEAELQAQGRLRSVVWRGPSPSDFDAEVEAVAAAVARAAAAVGAFGARVRREERLV